MKNDRTVRVGAVLVAGVLAVCSAWAKPILPGGPEKVVGDKGVGAVDAAAVAAAEASRTQDLAALSAWKEAKKQRADKLMHGRSILDRDPAGARKVSEDLLGLYPGDDDAADLQEDAARILQRNAEREAKEKAEAQRKAREVAEKAQRERQAALRKANEGKIEGLIDAGDAALAAGNLAAAEARYHEVLAIDSADRDARRGLEKVQDAREEAAAEAAEQARIAGLRKSLDEALALLKTGKPAEAKAAAEAVLKEDLPRSLRREGRALVKDAEKAIRDSEKK